MSDGITWFLLFFVLSAGLVSAQHLKAEIERRLSLLEGKIDKVMDHLGIKPDPVPHEVAGLVQAGRKIEAIKRYREATGAGLREAKEAVERIGAQKKVIER